MAQISGDLSATGSVTLTKQLNETVCHLDLSGTYGSVSFVIEGTRNGSTFAPLAAILKTDNTIASGTLSPADNASLVWDILCAGFSQVRARVTSIGSGTATFNLLSAAYSSYPTLNVFQATAIGAATGTSVAVTAGLTSSGATGAGIGYATGAGGAVTQTTSRSTGVTLNKLSGTITTDTTSLAAGAEAEFTVTNSTVAATDTVIVSLKSGSTGVGTCVPYVSAVAAGSFKITISNQHASTAETGACVLNFAVLKATAS